MADGKIDELPVPGSRAQRADDRMALFRGNKESEERILRCMDALAQSDDIDKRWLAVARTDIEKGFMALNRAIMKPTRFALPGDEAGS